MSTQQTVKIQLVRSPIGTKGIPLRHCARPGSAQAEQCCSELQDTPAVRGMINKISYLVKIL